MEKSMSGKFVLHSVSFANNGRRICYDYTVDTAIAKYFNKLERFYASYQVNVEHVPASIAVIPLLANIMPIAWFVGFEVHVEELDETFAHSLDALKKEFSIYFPNIKPNSELIVGRLVSNTISGNETALLFSGGLDAFESLTRNIALDPYLVSIHGADIDIKDIKRWDDFKRFNSEQACINKSKLCYVESNLQTFYTYEVDLLVDIGWWGKIQHGMALLSLIAPLSHIYGITTVMIASSNTEEVSFGWGSTSETDEKVRWANQKVVHDGFDLRRTEKIENIIRFAQKTGEKIKLRVCYSEHRTAYNCSRCPKCQRTMLGFILENEDPDSYGFSIPADFYQLLLGNFVGTELAMSVGVKYEWSCLQKKAEYVTNPFVICDQAIEKEQLNSFIRVDLDTRVNTTQHELAGQQKLKFIFMRKFPQLFQAYLSIRTKF